MPKSKQPETIEEYINWAKKKPLMVDFVSDYQSKLYEQNAIYVESIANNHNFFKSIDTILNQSSTEYREKKKSSLFMNETPSFKLVRKTYESMINKSYRYNVLWNPNFAKSLPPSKELNDNWLTPDNWFSRINDTVRSKVVCKYIDGPKFLAEKLTKHATNCGLKSRYNSQQNDDGYYAYHFYVKVPVEMAKNGNQVVIENVDIEIQLATQLQEVLYQITHTYYENLRIAKEKDPHSWKWEIKSNRFRAGYLSHTLHLLEAIILEVRNANNKVGRN